ncbi:hypothetical protein GJU90_00075 [Brucella sp. 10RB9210]|nr:hypothetical protein [Brucella sp. 10RB9210]
MAPDRVRSHQRREGKGEIMATTIEGGILDALQYHLSLMPVSPARPIAWPGISFTPQTGTPYLAVNDFPTDTITRTIANDGTAIYEGFLQVSAF